MPDPDPSFRPEPPTHVAATERFAPAEIEAVFERQRQFDSLGHGINVWVAAVGCLAVAGPVTVAQAAIIPLVGCLLIRLAGIHGNVRRFAASPFGVLMWAWLGWCLLAVLWAPDRAQAIDEISDLRWVLLPVTVWAVLDRRRVLVGALAAGLGVGMGVLIVRAWHPTFLGGTPPLDPDRLSGWWRPVVAGTILTAAVGLHLPAAMLGRGRVRVVGVVGAVVMGAGVLATGTRGAWIATGVLVVVMGVWAVVQMVRAGTGARAETGKDRVSARAIVLPVVVGVVLAGAAWAAIRGGGGVERRFERGIEEVRRALGEGDYDSDTGQRLLMARWAVEAMGEHPVRGVGLGGYRAWVHGKLERERGHAPPPEHLHGHAHNSILHIGATLGVVGVGIVVAAMVLIFRAELRCARITLARVRRGETSRWAVYDMGPACALLGMVLVSGFDAVHLNAQTSAVLFVLIGLCVPRRPTVVG